MENIKYFCKQLFTIDASKLKRTKAEGIYTDSLDKAGESYFFLARKNGEKVLIAFGQGEEYDKFKGEEYNVESKKCKIYNWHINEKH